MMDLDRVRPKDMPKLRQEVLANTREVMGNPGSVFSRYLSKEDATAVVEGLLPVVAEAPLWWVSEDMTRTAQSAAKGMGADMDLPITLTGVVFFGGKLPPFSVAMPKTDMVADNKDGVIPIGFFWYFYKHNLIISPIVESPYGPRILSGFSKTPVLHCVSGPSKGAWRYDDREPGYPGEVKVYIDILAAMWSLSQTPTVATTTTKQVAGPKIKGQRRRQPPSDVKVVELRQMRHENVTHSGSGRRYTHRWMVRGHWRDQACGPGLKERRATWVPAYTKGPADAPLIEKETVFAWRR